VAGLAVVAASAGNTGRAGQLWGALDVLEDEAGAAVRGRDPSYVETINACAAASPAVFAAAYERGRSMSRADAIAYVLDDRGDHA
jgi:hypothetical protein